MTFRKNQQDSMSPKDTGTIIGSGIVLENVIVKGIGYVRVDGTVIGDIQLEGHLILGETGRITGEVHATSAQFFGTYEGNIYVDETLRLAPNCHVDGNVRTGKLIIDEGADFHGTCNMDMNKVNSQKMISFIKEIDNGDKNLLSGPAAHLPPAKDKEHSKDKDHAKNKESAAIN